MLGTKLDARSFLDRVAQELGRINPAEVKALADAIFRCYEERRFVFVIGNGGSGSNASHFSEDLGKCTLRREDFDNDQKKRLRILSLTDNTPYILAWANDEGFERVFVEQLKNLASPGDLLIAISGSGNSPNILRAVEWAIRNGLKTFGCTGFSGGKLRTLTHQGLHVPLDDMGIAESIHLTAFHWVVDNLHARLAAGEGQESGVRCQESGIKGPKAGPHGILAKGQVP
jgi:D-sedoheptulose 7-phosphate isomerase